MGSQDTEITLGTGKMLALFFSLVALCGLFFGLGFSLGRGSVRPLVTGDQAQVSPSPVLRNSSMKSTGNPPSQPGEGTALYKASDQKDASAQSDTPATNTPLKDAATAAQGNAAPPDPMTTNAGPGYFVQVAAVSKSDDAQALVDALKKKQYAAFTSNSSSTDRYFHVQVGPFADLKDAEATKAKLISDGYNPILKK